MRSFTLLLTALLAGAALAGCTGGDDGADPTPTTTTPGTTPSDPFATPPGTPAASPAPTTPTPGPAVDSNSFTLQTTGAPTQVKTGAGITFTLYANGTANATSDHIGAHYADNDTTTPTTPGRKDCEHTNGTLPGSWSVGCTFAEAGTWHVYGHAQAQGAVDRVNFWATPFVVRVRDYNLTATVPAQATYGTDFDVILNVTALGGSDNATSDHVGAHWFNDTTGMSEAESAGSCAHLAGSTGVVGTHTITCNVPQEGDIPASASRTVYVRGHVRVTEGGTTLSWWSEPYAVSVQSVTVPLPGFP